MDKKEKIEEEVKKNIRQCLIKKNLCHLIHISIHACSRELMNGPEANLQLWDF